MIADADIPGHVVRAFAAHLARELGASVVSPMPGYLRTYLSIMGGNPDRYALTVGRTIYMPVELGATRPGWSAWSQMMLLVHECQHVAQGERRSMLERAIDYATSTARRTEVETQAFSAELELEHWRRGEIAAWWFSARASSLGAYHVSGVDLAVCERHLRVLSPTVRRSGYVTHAGRVAIQWLDRHAPELRHPSVPSRASS